MVYINERWRGRDVKGGGHLFVWCANPAFAQRHSGKPPDSRLLSARLKSGPPEIDAEVPRARLRCVNVLRWRRTHGDERKNLTSVQANNCLSQYREEVTDWTLEGSCLYRGAGKSLARPGRKQATATDFEFHIFYL